MACAGVSSTSTSTSATLGLRCRQQLLSILAAVLMLQYRSVLVTKCRHCNSPVSDVEVEPILAMQTNYGHFAYGTIAYWTVHLLFGHFAYWPFRLLVTSPTRHFAYWTVHLLDTSPTRHFAYCLVISQLQSLQRFYKASTQMSCTRNKQLACEVSSRRDVS